MKGLIRVIEKSSIRLVENLNNVEKVFLTDKEYDNQDDLIYELPRTFTVTKYGYYVEYVIVEIKKGGVLKCRGIGEDYGDKAEQLLAELTTDNLITLAEELVYFDNQIKTEV